MTTRLVTMFYSISMAHVNVTCPEPIILNDLPQSPPYVHSHRVFGVDSLERMMILEVEALVALKRVIASAFDHSLESREEEVAVVPADWSNRCTLSFRPHSAHETMLILTFDQPKWATPRLWWHFLHFLTRLDSDSYDVVCGRNDTLLPMAVVVRPTWQWRGPIAVAPRSGRNNCDKKFVHNHDNDVFVETK
jgi:hypothetical protein